MFTRAACALLHLSTLAGLVGCSAPEQGALQPDMAGPIGGAVDALRPDASAEPAMDAGGQGGGLIPHRDGGAVGVDGGALDATPRSDGALPDMSPSDAGRPDAGPPTLIIRAPQATTLDEMASFSATIDVDTNVEAPLALFIHGLPPGASWDPATREVRFTPDFTQGGETWTVEISARAGELSDAARFDLTVRDSIRPPAPEVVQDQGGAGYRRLQVRQITDGFLDHPAEAGRTFNGYVMAPDEAPPGERLPVRVLLHGFSSQPPTEGWRGEFRVAPHDPHDTYWWGYRGPGEADATPYTARRVLHLLDWVLETYPHADPDNVYIEGASMGGAGAATIGLLWARHFNMVHTTIGQWIPRNHRPSRKEQLAGHWGPPEAGTAWDRMDLTHALGAHPEAADQYVFLKHGKDDPIIHFGAVVHPSPLTGLRVYEALQGHRVGHLAVWDEGGHGSLDPLLGAEWWTQGWNPVFDDTSWLRRGVAFPAFSNASGDDDPGSGLGNGRRDFNADRGYAGFEQVAGDTGWDGEVAGALNRALRWDANELVDEADRFEVPLRVLSAPSGPAPREGWPVPGDVQSGPLPTRVDVTLRRVQRFQLMPGVEVRWRKGAAEGVATANDRGVLTILGVPMSAEWETLVIVR